MGANPSKFNIGDTSAGGNTEKDARRALMGFLTAGTSEIKTGAGQYGDETVADSLFPKNLVGGFVDGPGSYRAASRAATDAKTKADAAAADPGAAPDATDARLMQARRTQGFKLLTGQDRKNSFGGL